MFYSLLGRVVWFGLRFAVRRKYGPTYGPKSLVAGAIVGIAIAVTVSFLRSARDAD